MNIGKILRCKLFLTTTGIFCVLGVAYVSLTIHSTQHAVGRRLYGGEPNRLDFWFDNCTPYRLLIYQDAGILSGSIIMDQSRVEAVTRIFLLPGEHVEYDVSNKRFIVIGMSDGRVDMITDQMSVNLDQSR